MKAHDKILRYDRALDCVHCGLCLPVCPTYRLTRKETASPRGRISLMRAFAEGQLEETHQNVTELDHCLVCRACETVCPSGVQFGEMMEISRDLLEDTPARRGMGPRIKRWFFRHVLPHPGRLRSLEESLRLYQKTGLRLVLQKLGLLQLGGRATVLRDAMLPDVPGLGQRNAPSRVTAAQGVPRARVGFLVGCVAHELLPEANRAAISVLSRNGCEVVCPEERPCCGALPLHFGDLEAARDLARRTIQSFPTDLDAIVVSSAGCASAMKDYGRLLEADERLRDRARRFSESIRDFTEFLLPLPLIAPEGRLDARVCFDEPCHLSHAQGIRTEPRQLIRSIPGVELVDFEGQESCCGAAGLSTVLAPEQSVELLEQKIAAVKKVAPDYLVTANPGCQLQLRTGTTEWLPGVEVMHVAELLEKSYQTADHARLPL